LAAVVDRLRRPGYLGANITVPYKETVRVLLDEVDPLAKHIGACNTIVNRDGKLDGHNTDAAGFTRALLQDGLFEPAGERVVVLGAGGVARAVCFALMWERVARLTISNRDENRARDLAGELQVVLEGNRADVAVVPWLSEALFTEVKKAHLVVNCTTLGMALTPAAHQSPLPSARIPRHALVFDLVYNPLETPLLTMARDSGAKTLGGLSMLVYQGAAAFELWTGRKAPVEVMMEAAKAALRAR